MMGRTQQLQDLIGIVDSSRSGRSHVAVISGPAGCGKTALVEELPRSLDDRETLLLHAAASHTEVDRPFGVLNQLGRQIDPSADGLAAGADPEALCAEIARLADRRPVVVIIDDVHLADDPSQRALAMLEHRLRYASFALVVTHLAGAESPNSVFSAEMARHPRCTRLALRPLCVDGVSRLSRAAGFELQPDEARAVHELTGGSPRLGSALIVDRATDVADPPVGAGELCTYLQGVFCCLRTLGPDSLPIAQSLALMDLTEPLDKGLDADLLVSRHSGVDAGLVRWTLDLLVEAGVLHGSAFRHPAAREALVRSVPSDELAGRRTWAADVLFDAGAPSRAVATVLCELDEVHSPWAVRVLRESAEADLADRRHDLALHKLAICARSSTDEAERAELTLQLLEIEWRHNPAAAARHIPQLVRANDRGLLRPESLGTFASLLAWYGRLDDLGAARPSAMEAAGKRSVPWLHLIAPVGPDTSGDGGTAPFTSSAGTGRKLLGSLTGGGSPAEATAEATNVLRNFDLQASTFDEVLAALTVLIAGDRFEPVAQYCDRLLTTDRILDAPTWHALVLATRADVALRQGDLTRAATSAEDALERVPAGGWGVAVAGPIATAALAATAMGRHDAAAAHLRSPLPAGASDTIFSAIHSHTYGWHHLTLGRPELASQCFHNAGALLRRRGVDRPGVLPWRSGALRAHLDLGHHEEATRLAREDLDLLEGAGPRTRGIVLSGLAATLPPARRFAALDEAIGLLTRSGDRLSLARALMDLSDAQRRAGDTAAGRTSARRGLSLARQCGAVSFRRDTVDLPVAVTPEKPVVDRDSLSDAERRVAVFASRGYTNREISLQLHVTVSTVEQHLTRIYRKLAVSRRTDLAAAVL